VKELIKHFFPLLFAAVQMISLKKFAHMHLKAESSVIPPAAADVTHVADAVADLISSKFCEKVARSAFISLYL